MKKSFLTGIFVLVPLVVSVALLLWFFEKVDGLFSPVLDGIVRALFPGTDHVPGTGFSRDWSSSCCSGPSRGTWWGSGSSTPSTG